MLFGMVWCPGNDPHHICMLLFEKAFLYGVVEKAPRRAPISPVQRCAAGMVNETRDRPVLDPLDGFVDRELRDQEPLPRNG